MVVVEDFHQWVEDFRQEEVVEACYLQVVVEVAFFPVATPGNQGTKKRSSAEKNKSGYHHGLAAGTR